MYVYISATLYVYCYFCYNHLFLKTVPSFHIIFSQMFLVLLGKSLIQKRFTASIPLLSHFGLFWGLILVVLHYLFRAAKPILMKVCITPKCLLHCFSKCNCKCFSEQVLLSWRPFWGIFWSALCYFSLFLENCLVSYEILHTFLHYIFLIKL